MPQLNSKAYRACSIIRSHDRRSHTVNCDVDLNCLRSHTTPPNADLNNLRSHGAPQNADLNTAKKKCSLQCLPLPENGACEFSERKKVNISPEKLSSRVVQLQNFHVHNVHVHTCTTPNKKSKIIGNRHTNCPAHTRFPRSLLNSRLV